MPEFFQFFLDQLQTNNFLSGGAVLMAVGALGALLRKWPAKIWDSIRCRFVTVVDIPDRDPAFQWVNDWLAVHPYGAEKARLLTVRTARNDDEDDDDSGSSPRDSASAPPRIIFSPAPGSHYFFYRGRFVILNRARKESETTSFGAGIRETFTITVFSRSRTLVTRLLEDARELAHPKGDERLSILGPEQYAPTWTVRSRVYPRSIESVVLPQGVMEDIIAQVEKFRRSRQWYFDRGIPYRLGVGLMGLPGSGKTTTVLAVASHFKADIAVLSLNGYQLGDDKLRDLLCSVPKNAFVLIEDIDCAFDRREGKKEKDNSVTFSGLLNAIDGVAAGEGRVLWVTSNKPHKLDPALIRAGRIDIYRTIGLPDSEQRSRLFSRFYPDCGRGLPSIFASNVKPEVSMAKLQGHLLRYRDSAEDAVVHADELDIPTVEAPKENADV